MKNKMLLIVIVILVLFAGLVFITNYKTEQASEDNPYGKEKLHQETIDILDDPLYQNIILPDELEEKIGSGDAVTVYFFSPDCVHCQRTTPELVPLAEENDIDLVKMNLMEFDEKSHYGIEGTPTMIHYEDGEEVARIVGEHSDDEFQTFFDMYVNE